MSQLKVNVKLLIYYVNLIKAWKSLIDFDVPDG